jgi:hypothetical protein
MNNVMIFAKEITVIFEEAGPYCEFKYYFLK